MKLAHLALITTDLSFSGKLPEAPCSWQLTNNVDIQNIILRTSFVKKSWKDTDLAVLSQVDKINTA